MHHPGARNPLPATTGLSTAYPLNMHGVTGAPHPAHPAPPPAPSALPVPPALPPQARSRRSDPRRRG